MNLVQCLYMKNLVSSGGASEVRKAEVSMYLVNKWYSWVLMMNL